MHSTIHKCTARFTNAQHDSQMHSKIHKCTARFTNAQHDSQMHNMIHKCTARSTNVCDPQSTNAYHDPQMRTEICVCVKQCSHKVWPLTWRCFYTWLLLHSCRVVQIHNSCACACVWDNICLSSCKASMPPVGGIAVQWRLRQRNIAGWIKRLDSPWLQCKQGEQRWSLESLL